MFSSLLDGLVGGEQEWIGQQHPTGFILLNAIRETDKTQYFAIAGISFSLVCWSCGRGALIKINMCNAIHRLHQCSKGLLVLILSVQISHGCLVHCQIVCRVAKCQKIIHRSKLSNQVLPQEKRANCDKFNT